MSQQNFATDRTRRFLASDLKDSDRKAVSAIEEHGCYVISVAPGSEQQLGWSYSFGIFDTAAKPEIVTVALSASTAHHGLNKAATLLRKDVDLTTGRHREIVGEVECIFRPVDPKWVKHLMNRAHWYYDHDPFPVLQLIYPDLENRFQWEDGFDERFKQPLLQPDVPATHIEDDFWASADPESSLFNWKFPSGPHSNAYLSKAVFDKREPVVFVSHDADDGAWQFLGDSMSDGSGVVVCLHHPLDSDPTLRELHDLPRGWYAERATPEAPWVRRLHPGHDDEPEPA